MAVTGLALYCITVLPQDFSLAFFSFCSRSKRWAATSSSLSTRCARFPSITCASSEATHSSKKSLPSPCFPILIKPPAKAPLSFSWTAWQVSARCGPQSAFSPRFWWRIAWWGLCLCRDSQRWSPVLPAEVVQRGIDPVVWHRQHGEQADHGAPDGQ